MSFRDDARSSYQLLKKAADECAATANIQLWFTTDDEHVTAEKWAAAIETQLERIEGIVHDVKERAAIVLEKRSNAAP